MTDRKLGEMSYDEIKKSGDLGTWTEDDWNTRADEMAERITAHHAGAPGKHAALSREQVRAFLGPLLGQEAPDVEDPALANGCECDQPSGIWRCDWCAAIHACARALLALPNSAAPPLED